MKEKEWTQCSLPVVWGGLGIRKATDLALPAFLASAHGADAGVKKLLPTEIFDQGYPEVEDAETQWKARFNNNDVQQPNNYSVQSYWDKPLCEHIYKDLLNSEVSPVEKARLVSVASEHASDWLNSERHTCAFTWS